MIVLPQSKCLWETFQKEYWPNYETEGGQKEYRNHYKLVLMTSVLEPEHYYHYVARYLMIVIYSDVDHK